MPNHAFYMQRCLDLANLGRGTVAPNPMVGAVIVHQDRIIGEGYHQQYGEAHAEVNAVNAVAEEDFPLLSSSTVYVSLEPCAHHGKTPPCADLLVRHKVKRVVIGIQDPFAKVAGRGIQKLRDAGIEVEVGVLEEACKKINERFFTFHEHKRPYVLLKWAESSNGFIAPPEEMHEELRQISGPFAQRLVHKWRSEETAIMVGTRTAEKDDPSLTVRHWNGQHPLRIVLDQRLTLSPKLKLFDQSTPTLVFTSQPKNNDGVIEYQTIDFDQPVVPQLLQALYDKQVQSVLVEGGAQLLQSFIDANLWDEARVFKAPTSMPEGGVHAPKLTKQPNQQSHIGKDELTIYYRD